MNNKKIILSSIILILFAFPKTAVAFCPVCIVAEGVGVGIFRWLGVDDLIVGFWMGGLIISLAIWFSDWLNKRKIKFPLQMFFISLVSFLLNLFFAQKMGLFKSNFRPILGFNRLLTGNLIGAFILFFSFFLDKYLRIKNNGRVVFFYQKVIIPLTILLLLSLITYFAGRNS